MIKEAMFADTENYIYIHVHVKESREKTSATTLYPEFTIVLYKTHAVDEFSFYMFSVQYKSVSKSGR